MRIKQSIVILGQVPPPYGGQAIMIERIMKFTSKFENVYHIKMSFAHDMDDISKFRFWKIGELIRIIIKVFKLKLNNKVDIFYYPAAGGSAKNPVYRDFALLLLTRFLFKKTIFHFHAGGLEILYNSMCKIERFFVQICFGKPDLSILLSRLNEVDAQVLHSKKNIVIPYGIEDVFRNDFTNIPRLMNKIPKILFVGIIKESKGIWILLEAAVKLKRKNIAFQIELVGKPESYKIEHAIKIFLDKENLKDRVKLHGVKVGKEKGMIYHQSDIFCFPTFFESEGLPIVIIEAMQYTLPVVTTSWRGIPDMIENNVNGFLCPIKNVDIITEKLELLISDESLRKKMGQNGRSIFKKKYTQDIFEREIIHAFENC